MLKLFMPEFDAEARWRPTDSATLHPSAAVSQQTSRDLDELMSLVCDDDDLFAVRASPARDLGNSFRRIGLPWNPIVLATLGQAACTPDVFRYQVTPFAVTSDIEKFCKAHALSLDAPAAKVVADVNSKAWSFRARADAGCPLGELAKSAEDVLAMGISALKSGSIFLKESYGVSGLGNVVVTTASRLATIHRMLKAQEDAGRSVEIIVEPALPGRRDFSSHFDLGASGEIRFIGYRSTTNVGSRYLASRGPHAEVVDAIGRTTYRSALERMLYDLLSAGYFGPVCFDSLLLEDGSIQAVLEINARMSMGYLSLALDHKLARVRLRSTLVKLRVSGTDRDPSVLRCLSASHLVPQGPGGAGVIALTSAVADPPSRGDVVLALLYRDGDEEERLARALEAAFRRSGMGAGLPSDLAGRLAQ